MEIALQIVRLAISTIQECQVAILVQKMDVINADIMFRLNRLFAHIALPVILLMAKGTVRIIAQWDSTVILAPVNRVQLPLLLARTINLQELFNH